MMKHGIVKNNKFLFIDEDLTRLKDTLLFLPEYTEADIKTYNDNEIEQASTGETYLKGFVPVEPAKSYQELRALEYPIIAEQLDMQYWDVVNGTNNWQEEIERIKAKYPKPVEEVANV